MDVCPYCGSELYSNPACCPACGEKLRDLRDGDVVTYRCFLVAFGAGAPCAGCPIADEKVKVETTKYATYFVFRGHKIIAFRHIFDNCQAIANITKQKPCSNLGGGDDTHPLIGGVGFGADD